VGLFAEYDALPEVGHACGALATGCELSIELESPPYSEFTSDSAMEAFYQANAEKLGCRFPRDERTGTAVNHQPEFAAWCAEPTGDRAVLDGALAMAWTVIDVATSEEQRRRLLSGR
jgi:hypothetical protein